MFINNHIKISGKTSLKLGKKPVVNNFSLDTRDNQVDTQTFRVNQTLDSSTKLVRGGTTQVSTIGDERTYNTTISICPNFKLSIRFSSITIREAPMHNKEQWFLVPNCWGMVVPGGCDRHRPVVADCVVGHVLQR